MTSCRETRAREANVPWLCGAAILLHTFLSTAAAAAAPERELLFNGSMELGETGRAAPGFYLRTWFTPEAAYCDTRGSHVPLTVSGGVAGMCVKVPGAPGLVEYNLESEPFPIDFDGEAVVSFSVKVGPGEGGTFHPTDSLSLDFRCYNHAVQYGTVAERYPVLESYRFTPTTEWKEHTVKVPVKKCYPYTAKFRYGSPSAALNALFVDNLSVRPAGQAGRAWHDEIAAVADHDIPAYFEGESVRFAVRALLNSSAAEEMVEATVRDDHTGAVVLTAPFRLAESATALGGDDSRSLYVGEWRLSVPRFGSFSASFTRSGAALLSKGGDFVVLHPMVRHPRYSPGWTIGTNGDGIVQLQITPEVFPTRHAVVPNVEAVYDLGVLAGMQTLRFWGDWNMIEPEEGVLKSGMAGSELKVARGKGYDVIFALGCTFTHAPPAGKPLKELKGCLPAWMYQKHTVRPGVALPPVDIWNRYVDFCAKTFGGQTDFWEIVNEPANGWTADEYMPLLKAAYATIKADRPEAVVIGNGATGDLGLRPLGWTKDLVERGHEEYLDAIAFHPYGAGLDSQNGDYFKFSDLVAGIRALLKKDRPLWCTECFYLASATIKQGRSGEEQAAFAAGDAQRHYLDSLLNGVVANTSLVSMNFMKRNKSVPTSCVPNEVAAGCNAMSFLMKDMAQVERLSVNKFIRVAVLESADHAKGLGFIYDLRPSGSTWIMHEDSKGALTFFDLFGNKIAMDREAKLTLDPIFVTGAPAALKELFTKSSYRAADPVRITARAFGDTVWFGGRNTTGMPAKMETTYASSEALVLPSIEFLFQRNNYNLVSVPGAVKGRLDGLVVPWRCLVDGSEAGTGTLPILPSHGEHVIPSGAPLRLVMSQGSALSVEADAESLRVKVEVKDGEIVAPKGESPWEGDALEVFIDADPFHRMDLDAVSSGDEKMNVSQYAFAALPPKDGAAMWSTNYRRGAFKTRAASRMERTAEGYILTASIPIEEINPLLTLPEILGIDVEIDHVDASGSAVKESLGPRPGECWRSRLQYPLFKLPPATVATLTARGLELFGAKLIENGDVERLDEKGFPTGWGVSNEGRPFLKVDEHGGFGETRGFVISVDKEQADRVPEKPLCVYQRLPCARNSKKTLNVQLMVKMDDLRVVREEHPSGYCSGFFTMVHYFDGTANRHLQNEGIGLSQSIVGSNGWRLLQFQSEIPDTATEITLSIGLRGKVAGTVAIDNVTVTCCD